MPSAHRKKYCFDSSAFINSWVLYYPPQSFSILWENITTLITEGRIIVCKEAEKEILAGNDDLVPWFKKNKSCVQPYTDEQIKTVATIVNKYPKVSQYHKIKPQHADPFVVALAKAENAIVVTWEGANGSTINPSIPVLCKEFKVECCNMVGLIQREGWIF